MARVGFIGVGNMGILMARNLIRAGHSLRVYDLSKEAVNFVVQRVIQPPWRALATPFCLEKASESCIPITG